VAVPDADLYVLRTVPQEELFALWEARQRTLTKLMSLKGAVASILEVGGVGRSIVLRPHRRRNGYSALWLLL